MSSVLLYIRLHPVFVGMLDRRKKSVEMFPSDHPTLADVAMDDNFCRIAFNVHVRPSTIEQEQDLIFKRRARCAF